MNTTYLNFRALRAKDGFTLIELLITVVILAILAAVVYSTLAPNKDTATNSRAIAAVQDAYQKALNYQGRTGSFLGFDAWAYKTVNGASSQVWMRIYESPGQLDPRFLIRGEKPGDAGTTGRVMIYILGTPTNATGIAICSTTPKGALFCLKEQDGKVTYLKVRYSPPMGTISSYTGSPTSNFPGINQDSWTQ